jgi:hypothetical protein
VTVNSRIEGGRFEQMIGGEYVKIAIEEARRGNPRKEPIRLNLLCSRPEYKLNDSDECLRSFGFAAEGQFSSSTS